MKLADLNVKQKERLKALFTVYTILTKQVFRRFRALTAISNNIIYKSAADYLRVYFLTSFWRNSSAWSYLLHNYLLSVCKISFLGLVHFCHNAFVEGHNRSDRLTETQYQDQREWKRWSYPSLTRCCQQCCKKTLENKNDRLPERACNCPLTLPSLD